MPSYPNLNVFTNLIPYTTVTYPTLLFNPPTPMIMNKMYQCPTD